MGLHAAAVPGAGVSLAVIPFGDILGPTFDGEIGSRLQIDSDPMYSQPFANALTAAAWICPLALDNARTAGKTGFAGYRVGDASLQSDENPARHLRLSF